MNKVPKKLTGYFVQWKEIFDRKVPLSDLTRSLEGSTGGIHQRNLQMLVFEHLYIFLVSPMKVPKIYLNHLYVATNILGTSRNKDGDHLSILCADLW